MRFSFFSFLLFLMFFFFSFLYPGINGSWGMNLMLFYIREHQIRVRKYFKCTNSRACNYCDPVSDDRTLFTLTFCVLRNRFGHHFPYPCFASHFVSLQIDPQLRLLQMPFWESSHSYYSFCNFKNCDELTIIYISSNVMQLN